MKLSLGVSRLDALLGGGIPTQDAALVYGRRFIGKEVLVRRFVLTSMEDGVPVIYVHAGVAADTLRETMMLAGPQFPGLEEMGLFRSVDAYSRPIGVPEDVEGTTYVDGPADINGIAHAINEIEKDLQEDHDQHVVIVDSVSTLIAHGDPQATFRFLRVVLGRAQRAGATALVLMDDGMHAPREVEMFRHLMDGSFDLKDHNGTFQMQVLGLGVTQNLGWIDYAFDAASFKLTGSFAAGRIR